MLGIEWVSVSVSGVQKLHLFFVPRFILLATGLGLLRICDPLLTTFT